MRDTELCWYVSEVELHVRGASRGRSSRWSQRDEIGRLPRWRNSQTLRNRCALRTLIVGKKVVGSLRHWSDERCLSTRFSACITMVLRTPTDLGVFCVPSGEALRISHRCLCARAPGCEYFLSCTSDWVTPTIIEWSGGHGIAESCGSGPVSSASHTKIRECFVGTSRTKGV